MERKKLGLELERLADRFSEGWHEGIKIDALDIVLLIEAAQALAQPTQESEEQRMLRRKWFGHRDTEHLSFVEAVEITMTTLMQQEQPAQEPKSVTYKEVADTMNALRKGNFSQQAAAKEVGELKLYTTPPQRPWVGLTEEETSGFTQHEMSVVKYVSKVLQEKNSA